MRIVIVPVFIVLTIVAFILAILFFYNNLTPIDSGLAEKQRVIAAITNEMPLFSRDGKPVIKISSISRHEDNWRVVTLQSVGSNNPVPVKVLVIDDGVTPVVVAGPNTYFEESELLRYNAPDSVILELKNV